MRREGRERADRRPQAASACDPGQTRTGFGNAVPVLPLFVRPPPEKERRGKGGTPVRAGPDGGADPFSATRSDRASLNRVRCAGRGGTGHRIPFWSGRRRTPDRPRGPLRARASPAPPSDPRQTGHPAGRGSRRAPREGRFSIDSGGTTTRCAVAWWYRHYRCPTAARRARYARNADERGPSKAKAADHPAADRRARGTAPPPRRRRLPGTPPARRPASSRERGTGWAVVAAVPDATEPRRPAGARERGTCWVAAASPGTPAARHPACRPERGISRPFVAAPSYRRTPPPGRGPRAGHLLRHPLRCRRRRLSRPGTGRP